jgi:hypothetical protein
MTTDQPAPPPASAPAPRPGHDEIVLAAPDGRYLCYSRQCATRGKLAEVLVTFGQMGTRFQDALWQESWGRTLAMCWSCWERTCQTARRCRPGLVVRDLRAPAGPETGRGRR